MLRTSFTVGLAVIALSFCDTALAGELQPCSDAAAYPELSGSLCAVAPAALDYAAKVPGETVNLFLRKFPAMGEARGQVWLVAGGPGESGAAFYPFLDTLRRSFPGFDLLVPDHRGTGYSSKLCPVEEAADSEDGISLAGSEWSGCIGAMHKNLNRTDAFTITNAAHDLSALIGKYRGDGAVYVYGVSYGTQLVLRMMQAVPPRIDGIILDGLVPPETTTQWDLSHRTEVVDQVGRLLLGPDQALSYERLLSASTANPAWLSKVPGRNLKGFMGALLDFPALRARIPELIDELEAGDTTTLERTLADLKALGASLSRYPQSPPSLPLVMLISGSENNARPDLTKETVAAAAKTALFTSPLPGFLVNNPVPLYKRDDLFGMTPDHLPPTLVIHGTLDPKTPYEGAVAHVDLLRRAGPIHLTNVEGAPHFVLFSAPDFFERGVSAFIEAPPPPPPTSGGGG